MRNLSINILDVGHGNCTVVTNGRHTALIDTGSGGRMLEYLRSENITDIDTIVISHADDDHIGGLVALLATDGFRIGSVYLNSDADKDSLAWAALSHELDKRVRLGDLNVVIGISEGTVIPTNIYGLELVALAPRIALIQHGPGAASDTGSTIRTNSASAVLVVRVLGRPIILLAGDLDDVGYGYLATTGQDLSADYLMLPHHGGRIGKPADTVRITRALCQAVSPKEVFISNGRKRFGNPRVDVISTVMSTLPNAHIACTQLSRACHMDPAPGKRVMRYHSAGTDGGHCCAGTIRLQGPTSRRIHWNRDEHDVFVDSTVAAPMCRPQPRGPVPLLLSTGRASAQLTND